MPRKVSFSNEHQDLTQIESHHTDVTEAIKEYLNLRTRALLENSLHHSPYKLKNERLAELELTSSLSILSAIEAAFRIDYLQRCYKRKKDSLSRTFRTIHRSKGSRVSLEDDILDSWRQKSSMPKSILNSLKGALKFRHWLAHGRYWEPKFGRDKYDYQSVYELAQTIFESFPFIT